MRKRAIVLLSGGVDSSTCMGIAKEEGFSLYPLTFAYGQRHAREIACARKLAEHYEVSHRQRVMPLPLWSERRSSALTDPGCPVPVAEAEKIAQGTIPLTYVPGRNLVFLASAVAYAEMMEAAAVYVGVSAVDYSNYPDCRPAFIDAFQATVHEGTKAGLSGQAPVVRAPLIRCSKAETIAWGLELGVPYQWTTSCYQGEELACGQCDSCRFRLAGFAACQVEDPISYAELRRTSPAMVER